MTKINNVFFKYENKETDDKKKVNFELKTLGTLSVIAVVVAVVWFIKK